MEVDFLCLVGRQQQSHVYLAPSDPLQLVNDPIILGNDPIC